MLDYGAVSISVLYITCWFCLLFFIIFTIECIHLAILLYKMEEELDKLAQNSQLDYDQLKDVYNNVLACFPGRPKEHAKKLLKRYNEGM